MTVIDAADELLSLLIQGGIFVAGISGLVMPDKDAAALILILAPIAFFVVRIHVELRTLLRAGHAQLGMARPGRTAALAVRAVLFVIVLIPCAFQMELAPLFFILASTLYALAGISDSVRTAVHLSVACQFQKMAAQVDLPRE